MPDLPNPLFQVHQNAQAEFQPYGELEIVSTFGEPQAEYAAIRKSTGLIDLPQRGILELTGEDRHAFLNNLLTNQIWSKETKTGLQPGQMVYAFFLNLKGRIVADMNVIEIGDDAGGRTLLDMDARLVEPTRAAFKKYVFTEKVTIQSRVGQFHQIALHGPRAAEVLNLTDNAISSATQRSLFDVPAIVWRDDPAAVPGCHLILPIESARTVWMNLLARHSGEPGKRLLRPVGWAAFNATRIEGGRPVFGIDFDDTILPAETSQLARGVSFTKGCYLGQEIVARMYARDQVAKKIVGIRMEDDALPIAGAQVFDDQSNVIGGITSSTISPVLSNAAIALGYVKRPHFEIGTKLIVPAEGKMRPATIVETPFVATDEHG